MPDANYFENNNDITSKLVFGELTTQKIDLSIVIPTYKRIDLLKKNLQAILKQKKVRKINYEVIVVSNDPDFDYHKIDMQLNPKLFKIFVNEKNLGMCGNMNRCVKLAQGLYVAFIQDDDVLLPEYITQFEQHYCSGQLEKIDCLIPNRYFLMSEGNQLSQFGAKAKRNMRLKGMACKILRFGKKLPELQKITPYESMITTYPFYAGGPTCGIVLKKSSLLASGGFDSHYPYGFDYAFFMNFSDKQSVYLLNEFLSIYMTSDSASNRPEVQYDFFRARYSYLIKHYKDYNISEKRKDLIIYSTYKGYPENVRKLINQSFSIKKVSVLACTLYMLWARIRVYKHGGYRREVCPPIIAKWYETL